MQAVNKKQNLTKNESNYFEKEFHFMLLSGRLLLQYSATTERVHKAINELANFFGIEARIFVDYKLITLTTKIEDNFNSRFSRLIPALTINMTAITQILRLIEQIKQGNKTIDEATEQLEKISQSTFNYHRWLIIFMLGITAGSLARIFQGDLASFFITGFATSISVILRQELAKIKLNQFLIIFLAAFVGSFIAEIAAKLGWTTTPDICLLVPSMMLVPGVHLINGVLDLVANHILMGIARLALSLVILSSITFGLLFSAIITETTVTITSSSPPLTLLEDVFFAGLVAAGFAISFNVPKKMIWACVICGMVGHGIRLLCIQSNPGIIWGNFLASIIVGVMTVYFSKRFHAPSAAIAFGAVVGMIPGIFVFRACSGLIQIMSLGANADLSLIATTLALSGKAVLMTLGIPLGLALPKLLSFHIEQQD